MKTFYTVLIISICFVSQAKAQIRAVDVDQKTGFSKAVVVTDSALVHTSQILPFEGNSYFRPEITSVDVGFQTEQVIKNLAKVLKKSKSSLEKIVRLNVYVAKEKDVAKVKQALSKSLPEKPHPACSFVVTPLEHPKARVAVDAIAATSRSKMGYSVMSQQLIIESEKDSDRRIQYSGSVTTLPKGRTLYISGMAERDKDIAKATAGTLKQLEGVMKLLDVKKKHIVHLKAFMKPMTNSKIVKDEVMLFMGKDCYLPPISFVEWKNGLPIEIELIAYIPDSNKTIDRFKGVTHNWQPKEKQSPVYCRFAIVDSPTRIYLAGMTPQAGNTPEEKVKNIFKQMQQTFKKTDSDLEHLVKATYYVAQDDVSSALNKVRPQFYNPKHPPAASKATVESVGDAKQKISIDMIAVPAK